MVALSHVDPQAPPDVIEADNPDPRVCIRIGTELHETVDRAAVALEMDDDIYQRAGALVHVTQARDESPTIRAVSPANLRERLTRCAKWEKREGGKDGGEKWAACIPTDNIVHALLHPGRAGEHVRQILGILESPSLRPDGSAIERSGFDDATGFLYLPAINFPAIPKRLDLDMAQRALAFLRSIFADFPFRSDGDRNAAIAAILTAVARPAIAGAVPAIIVDASTPGSGKTLVADVVSIVVTGRTAPRMTFGDDDNETDKLLGACALQGDSIVFFDNIPTATAFGGAPIDKVLTCEDATKFRILGKTEAPAMRWRAVMLGTGNNVTWKGDTFRRVLAPRLEPTVENPEERTGFAHEDLRAWVRENRARAVVAALTVLRAYVEAGRPKVCKQWGSFEAWSNLIPSAIVWAGGADPMACRPAADDDSRDEERAQVSALMGAIERVAPPEGVTARGLVDALYPPDRIRGEAPPDGHEEAREAIEALTRCPPRMKPDANKLGYTLRKWRRRVVGDRRLETGKDRTGVARWLVARKS